MRYVQPTTGFIKCGETVSGSTVGADDVIGCIAGDFLYKFTTSTSPAMVTFDGCASSYDTYLRVYDSNLFTE